MSLEEKLEKVFSRELSTIRQKLSREKASEELVEQAKARARQCPVTVSDLFAVYGNWSKFYLRVIFMNAIVIMLVGIDDTRMNRILYREDQFSGSTDIIYDAVPTMPPSEIIKSIKDPEITKKLKETVKYGQWAGLFYAAYNYKADQRFLVLKCGVFYFCSMLLGYAKYGPLLRTAVFISNTVMQTGRVTAFMHMMQSVPAHLRPLAMFVIQATGYVKLPDQKAMERSVKEKKQTMAREFVASRRHTIQVYYVEYMDEVADLLGCRPSVMPKFFYDPNLATKLFFHGLVPYQYRLEGPHSWPGARDAILSYEDRVFNATRTRKTPDTMKSSPTAKPLNVLRLLR